MRTQANKPRLYIAAPLFNVAEKEFNVKLKGILSPYFRVYLPQEDGTLLADVTKLAVTEAEVIAASQLIFREDIEAIRSVDLLLAILDGRTIDEGTAFEIGFAYALGKTCFGLQTDVRRLLPYGNNPMITHSLQKVFKSTKELKHWAIRYSSRSSN